MQSKIIGFHKDEEDDWVAELECHHGQHVRHQPPFINRPWTITPQGRSEKIGHILECVKCDQNEPIDIW